MSKKEISVVDLNGGAIQRAIDSLSNGGVVLLGAGDYLISQTIIIPNNILIKGRGKNTRLILGKNINSNVFTNKDHNLGNENISFESFAIDGNSENQKRPEDQKKLSFANGVYFRKVKNCSFREIATINVHQTGLHFNNCKLVRIEGFYAEKLGWSGFSTSGTDDLVAVRAEIIDSGRDHMHSAIHLDGGKGAYLEINVDKCTGNAVMLDSSFAPMSDVVICRTACRKAKRGVSLSGSHNNQLSNVLIESCLVDDNETGIMVSNSSNVFVSNCTIKRSSKEGILLQGKFGATNTVISGCEFENNEKDIVETHASAKNYFVKNSVQISARQSVNLMPVAKHSSPSQTPTPMQNKSPGPEHQIQDIYKDICAVCGYEGDFELIGRSVRESYNCKNCKASLRHREMARTITALFSQRDARSFKDLVGEEYFRKLKIYEPGIIGPLRKYFKDFPQYLNSYYWDDVSLGDYRDGIQNQDLMNLTFVDGSFDLIITADIFEHVRRPFLGFKEIHRVLKMGGIHIFTVPSQYPMRKKTHYRVDTSGDEDVYIDPPHYHIAGDGGKSLVYTEFGEDMLQNLGEMGLETKIMHPSISNSFVQKNITFYSIKKM